MPAALITREVAQRRPLRLEVDKEGLDALDRRMLRSIIEFYGGGPVGLETLAATINEEAVTLEDVYEPYLLQHGYLTRHAARPLRHPPRLRAPGPGFARAGARAALALK